MLQEKPRPATYADIEALPANMVGQIVFGVLHAHPRPTPRHAIATNALATKISEPFQFGGGGPGGWIFMNEPELHLGAHTIVPDLAGWKVERLSPIPDTAFVETPPDWICEVLSPSTQKLDRTDKLTIYAESAVGHCWYVDPLARTLEVFALVGKRWQLAATFKDADAVAAPPFETHTFPLDALWGPTTSPPGNDNPK